MDNSKSIFTVDLGSIELESVYCLLKSDNCYVWDVGCVQKYPIILGFGSTSVIIHFNENTMRTIPEQKLIDNNRNKPTTISLNLGEGHWSTFGEAYRYDILLCTIKLESNLEMSQYDWHRIL
jgi:hypothetical protein